MKKLTILLFSILITAPFMANAINLITLDNTIQDKRKEITQAQFDVYLLTLEGVEVNWFGKVSDVKWLIEMGRGIKGENNRYTLHLVDGSYNEFSKKSTITINKLILTLPILDRELALSLNKNQEYNFSGSLTRLGRKIFNKVDDGFLYGFLSNIKVSNRNELDN